MNTNITTVTESESAEIVQLRNEGKSFREISRLMGGISPDTIRRHLRKGDIKPMFSTPGRKGIDTSEIVRLRNEGKSYREISALVDISRTAIKYHLKKANYPVRRQITFNRVSDPSEILRLQDAGKTYEEIAATLNISVGAVRYHLDRAKLEDSSQLIESIIEYHRVKRIELENKIANLQKELDWVKTVEVRLCEKMQRTVGQKPDGILLTKNGRHFVLTQADLDKLLAATIKSKEEVDVDVNNLSTNQ